MWFSNWLGTAKSMSSPEEAEAFHLKAIGGEISILEKNLSGDHQCVGFCHNDLQYGNIMIDEETRSITIIVSIFPWWVPFLSSIIVVFSL